MFATTTVAGIYYRQTESYMIAAVCYLSPHHGRDEAALKVCETLRRQGGTRPGYVGHAHQRRREGVGHGSREELPPIPVIRIEGLRKSFGDHVVLRDIDFEVMSGEVVTIIGASGFRQVDAPALHQPPRDA